MPPFQIGQRPLGTPRPAPPMQRTPPIASNPAASSLPPNFGTALGVPQPPPLDPIRDSQVALNQRNYNDTNAALDTQQSDTLRSFGLDDPSDPFSRQALLRQHYEAGQRGTTNGMAARGQLYSGALQSETDQNAVNFEAGVHGLREQQNSILAAIAQRRAAARSGLDQGNINADSDALNRAVAAPVDPLTLGPGAPKPGPVHRPLLTAVAQQRSRRRRG